MSKSTRAHFPAIDAVYFSKNRTSSTMDWARRSLESTQFRSKETPSFVSFSSKIQTKGRGTCGSSWVSPHGNMHLTSAVPSKMIRKCQSCDGIRFFWVLSALCFLYSVRAMAMLCHSTKGRRQNLAQNLRLKWPNDILYGSKKLGGMLIEQCGQWFLVGMGVNIKKAPKVYDGGRKTTCLTQVHSRMGISAKQASIPYFTKRFNTTFIRQMRRALLNNELRVCSSKDAIQIASSQDLIKLYKMELSTNILYRDRSDPKLLYRFIDIDSNGALIGREVCTKKKRTFESEYPF